MFSIFFFNFAGNTEFVLFFRPVQLPQVHGSLSRPVPPRQHNIESPPIIEEQGIPWWRRKDLNTQ